MVNFDDTERIEGNTSVRLPTSIKRRLEQVAKVNRKSLSAEIVARLVRSLDLDPSPDADERPIASTTATEALARVKSVEKEIANLIRRVHALETRG